MRCFQSSVSSFGANRIPPIQFPSAGGGGGGLGAGGRRSGDQRRRNPGHRGAPLDPTPPLGGGVIKGGTRSYEGKHLAPETCGARRMCSKSSACGKRGYPLKIQIPHHPTFPGSGILDQSVSQPLYEANARFVSAAPAGGVGGMGQPPPNGGSLMIVVTFHRIKNQVAIFMECDLEPRIGPTIFTRFTLVASNQRFLVYRVILSFFQRKPMF